MTLDRIVYILSRWGEPSQTFVRREATAMERLGVDVSAMSLKPVGAEPGGVDGVWLSPWQVVAGLVRMSARRPGRVARVLWTVLRHSGTRTGPATIAAAVSGLAWVGAGRLPPGHLHAHFGWVAATATWAAATVDDRTFSVVLHAFEIHDARYRDGFTPIPLGAAKRVFVISERDRQTVRDRWAVDPVVAHIGVPSSWITADLTGNRDRDLVVSVGRLVEKKGFSILIEALSLTRHPWRCHIVGDGELEIELGEQVDRLGVADRVTFRGSRSEAEVQSSLQGAAVMCLACVETASGDRDGTPTVIVEAMASGAAVVTTDVGGIVEMVGDAGIVVDQRDPEAIAGALDRLAADDLRNDLVRRGRERVREGWTTEMMAALVLRELSS